MHPFSKYLLHLYFLNSEEKENYTMSGCNSDTSDSSQILCNLLKCKYQPFSKGGIEHWIWEEEVKLFSQSSS